MTRTAREVTLRIESRMTNPPKAIGLHVLVDNKPVAILDWNSVTAAFEAAGFVIARRPETSEASRPSFDMRSYEIGYAEGENSAHADLSGEDAAFVIVPKEPTDSALESLREFCLTNNVLAEGHASQGPDAIHLLLYRAVIAAAESRS